MKIIIFCLCVFGITSCFFSGPTPATEAQKENVFKHAVFDSNAIKNLSKYQELNSFLQLNADSIIAFRDSKNFITEVAGNGKPDSTYLQKSDCYTFFQGNSQYDITNVPNSLKEQLNKTFQNIGDSSIRSFTVCKDKTITVRIKQEDFENGLSLYHDLIWNSKSESNVSFMRERDTIVQKNCVYRIVLDQDYGW